jgi:hypothetical protein
MVTGPANLDGRPILAAKNPPPPATTEDPNPSSKVGTPKLGRETRHVSGSLAKVADGGGDAFLLETLFPEPREVFHPSSAPDPKSDCIVALDTNALLLQYSVAKDDLKDLRDVYSKIADERRLFLPERAVARHSQPSSRQLARNNVELLAAVFADHVQRATTAGTVLAKSRLGPL